MHAPNTNRGFKHVHAQSNSRKRIWQTAALSAAALAGLLAVGLWYLNQPPAPDGNPQAVAQYVQTDQFRNQPSEARREFLAQARENDQLTDEQRRNLWRAEGELRREEMERRLDERINAWLEADPATRNKLLDEAIDEMQQRLAEMERRRAEREANRPPDAQPRTGGDGQRGADRPDFRERQQRRIDNVNPGQRALRTEYFAALRARAEARGIQLPERGPWGGGGGPRPQGGR